ncbi:hypothetical protein PM082_003871 [Marasmius tenuissimus]|nr:hypothetical protein PM082_003871 [Marasmius tenuissimus]
MDPALYKDVETSRGFKYHYYFSAPKQGKQTLVFLHGFPSTSYDWRYQVPFFKKKGYGIIVPDTLGYGGTAKPTDPAQYKYSLLVKDITDILDAEKIDKAVFIGHDWGSMIAARMVNYFPERVSAFACLAVAYAPPNPQFDYEYIKTFVKERIGYESVGYWAFLNEEDAAKTIEANFEKFYNIVYPEDPELWKSDFTPMGALKDYLTTKPAAPSPSWLTAEEKQVQTRDLLAGGLAAPTCYYKGMLRHAKEDDQAIPLERYKTDKPHFFGAALEDYVAVSSFAVHQTKMYCENATIKEFEANHWVQLQKADQVNRDLGEWLEGL